MKKIAILGSTGSIGTQTLEVVRENKDIEVLGLAAGKNIELLEQQIREFHPVCVAVWSEGKAEELKVKIADTATRVVTGMEGLIEIATLEKAEILVTAIVGMIGLRPTIASLIMSLESVISAISGWLLLDQALSAREIFGCVLMFCAIVLAQLPEKRRAQA
mgnify:CR=1 FL=1